MNDLGGFFGNRGNSSGGGGGFFSGNNGSSGGGFFSNNNQNSGNNNSGGGFFNNRNNNSEFQQIISNKRNLNSGSSGYGYINNNPGSYGAPTIIMVAPVSAPSNSNEDWNRDSGLKSDTSKIAKIMQIFPQEAQKLIELETMNEFERREALQKLALERDLRLQGRIEFENYKHQVSKFDQDFLSQQRFAPTVPLRNRVTTPLVFTIPSRTTQQALKRELQREQAVKAGSKSLAKSRLASEMDFTILDPDIIDSSNISYTKVMSGNTTMNKTRPIANFRVELSFLDHRVLISTKNSTSMTLDQIRRKIIQNWCTLERERNPGFSPNQDFIEALIQCSRMLLDNYICKDLRSTLKEFANTADIDFNEVNLQIIFDCYLQGTGIRILASESFAENGDTGIKNVNYPEWNEPQRTGRLILQEPSETQNTMFPQRQEMLNELNKKPGLFSQLTTNPGTLEKHEEEGISFGGMRGAAPRPFTSSQPSRGTISADAHSFFCEEVPKLRDPGLKTRPSMEELERMGLSELSRVEGFEVFNSEGGIQFLEPVDLRGVDLDSDVCIGHGYARVYPPGSRSGGKPPAGEKLNVRAVVTLHGVRDAEKDVPQDSTLQLMDSMEGQLLDWDAHTGTLRFSVTQF